MFNLKKGYKNEEIYAELKRIGVSGETKQEVQLFLKPGENHVEKKASPLHSIILANENYAVIRKTTNSIDQFGSYNQTHEYFLTGINDEKQYFVRPIANLPQFEKLSLSRIVDWVNRIDQEFVGRLQGDVLFKFSKINTPRKKINHEQPSGLESIFSNPQASPRQSLTSNLLGNSFRPRNETIEIDGLEYRLVSGNPLKLGNHKLWTEGKIYVCVSEPFVAVSGQSLVLQHYEHQVTEKPIPESQVIVLSAQRGRDFETKQFLQRAFD